MIIIIDKVFYPQTLETINNENKHAYFKKEEEHDNAIVARRLMNTAANYFNFDSQVGYDIWFHRNGMPDWHKDRDEQTFFKTGQSHFPICSIVFSLLLPVTRYTSSLSEKLSMYLSKS